MHIRTYIGLENLSPAIWTNQTELAWQTDRQTDELAGMLCSLTACLPARLLLLSLLLYRQYLLCTGLCGVGVGVGVHIYVAS